MTPAKPRQLRARSFLDRPGLLGYTSLPKNVHVVMPPEHRKPPTARPVRLPLPVDSVGGETKPVDILLLPDDSGSMYGAWGDEHGVRYAAGESVIDLMIRLGGGRAAVVHWGTEAPASQVLSLTDVRSGRRQLRKALQIPPTLGGNNFPAAIRRAAEVLQQSDDSRVRLTFALTDGIEYLTPDIHSALAMLPAGSVHVLLVDRSGGCNEALEQQWRSLPLGSFKRLDVFDTKRMAWQIAEVLAEAVGLTMPEPVSTTVNSKDRPK